MWWFGLSLGLLKNHYSGFFGGHGEKALTLIRFWRFSVWLFSAPHQGIPANAFSERRLRAFPGAARMIPPDFI